MGHLRDNKWLNVICLPTYQVCFTHCVSLIVFPSDFIGKIIEQRDDNEGSNLAQDVAWWAWALSHFYDLTFLHVLRFLYAFLTKELNFETYLFSLIE